MDDEVIQPKPYPAWRQALEKFLATGFPVGPENPIERQWFYSAMEIEFPTDDMTKKKADRLELLFLGQFECLREELLEAHQIDLLTNNRGGYFIVPPGEQSGRAYQDGVAQIRKAMRRMMVRIACTDASKLTAEERRQQIELAGRACRLQEIEQESRRRSLPPPE